MKKTNYKMPLRLICPFSILSLFNDQGHADVHHQNASPVFSWWEVLHSNITTCHLLRLASRSQDQAEELRSRRLPGAGVGCHKRWFTVRLLEEKKHPMILCIRYLIYTHPISRRSQTMAQISCSPRFFYMKH